MEVPEQVERNCLRCNKLFLSRDRKRNWICGKCTSAPDPFSPREALTPDHWEAKSWQEPPGWIRGY